MRVDNPEKKCCYYGNGVWSKTKKQLWILDWFRQIYVGPTWFSRTRLNFNQLDNVCWKECVDSTPLEKLTTSSVIMVKKETQLEVQGQGTALSLTAYPSFLISLDV